MLDITHDDVIYYVYEVEDVPHTINNKGEFEMIVFPKSYAELSSKIDLVMSTLELKSDASGLYALVPSTNDFSSAVYRVNINEETMLSEDCQCQAASYDQDCCHRNGVDRTLEDARALLFAAKKAALKRTIVIVEEVANIEELPLQEQEQLQAAEQVELPVSEDGAPNYGKIVNGKLINVRWSELTPQEQADAYRNYVSLLSRWN